jgi:hypothetical protein
MLYFEALMVSELVLLKNCIDASFSILKGICFFFYNRLELTGLLLLIPFSEFVHLCSLGNKISR